MPGLISTLHTKCVQEPLVDPAIKSGIKKAKGAAKQTAKVGIVVAVSSTTVLQDKLANTSPKAAHVKPKGKP